MNEPFGLFLEKVFSLLTYCNYVHFNIFPTLGAIYVDWTTNDCFIFVCSIVFLRGVPGMQ